MLEDKQQEGVDETKILFDIKLSDEDLVREINENIRESKPLYEEMKNIQENNEKYYLGTQLDESNFEYEIPTAENILYVNTETVVSISTSQRKEPLVLAAQDTDESRDLASKTQRYLTIKWNNEKMITKYEDWIRHANIYRLGVFKLRYNNKKDDYDIKVVRPQRIIIDKDATDEDDAKFIAEYKDDTIKDLIDMFPKAKEKLIKAYGKELGTTVHYIEYWTNDFVVWKVDNIILDKRKNPYWDWEESDREDKKKKLKDQWIKKKKIDKNILLNYFDSPRKPYVILSFKNLGKSIYADTSDFDQGKVVQDIINKNKRLINTASQKALGREVYSGDYIDKNEAKKSAMDPSAPVWIQSGDARLAFNHIAPQPVSDVLITDLQESKAALDNIMSAHGTTRGERGPTETASGRNILREGDYGRIDLAVRRANEKLELLYEWMMQMAKVFYTEDKFMKYLGQDAADYIKFSQDDIEDGQEVMVKSELTVDKAMQRESLAQKLGAGQIDPLSYFEAIDDPNPKEKANRMIMYQLVPMAYMAQYTMDSNSPGADKNPIDNAEKQNKGLDRGEPVQPFVGANTEHIKVHTDRMKKPDFADLDDEIKLMYRDHIQAELEIIKQSRGTMQSNLPNQNYAQNTTQPTGAQSQ
jgi:hypothetical protein